MSELDGGEWIEEGEYRRLILQEEITRLERLLSFPDLSPQARGACERVLQSCREKLSGC